MKKSKLTSEIRDFLGRLFMVESAPTVERGKHLTEECYRLVQDHVMGANARNWVQPLLAWAGENSDVHQHSANVALFSTLIAERLGIGNVDSIAVAAILHDVGVAKLESNDPSDPRYRKHPDYSVKFLKARKFVFPEIVYRLILQHHERQNGRGYPFGISRNILLPETLPLSLCDEIDYRIQFEDGKAVRGPMDILNEMYSEAKKTPGQAPFDPDFLKRVIEIFLS